MNKNFSNPKLQDDEINLVTVVKALLNSKIIIFFSALIFLILALFYAFQKQPLYQSNAFIEIGQYGNINGSSSLIENPSSIIQNVKINLIYKNIKPLQSDEVNVVDSLMLNDVFIAKSDELGSIEFQTFEGKIISIKYISDSIEQNMRVLNKFINHIIERHSSIEELVFKDTQKSLIDNINSVKLEIAHFKAVLKSTNSNQMLTIKNKIISLENDLPFINRKIEALKQILIDEQVNLNLLLIDKDSRKERAMVSPTLEQILYTYKMEIISVENSEQKVLREIDKLNKQLKIISNNLEPYNLFSLSQRKIALEDQLQSINMLRNKTQLINEVKTSSILPNKRVYAFIGFIFGLFFGIFLVLVKDFTNTFRKSSAST